MEISENSISSIVRVIRGEANATVTIDFLYNLLPDSIKRNIRVIKKLGSAGAVMIVNPEKHKSLSLSLAKNAHLIEGMTWGEGSLVLIPDKNTERFRKQLLKFPTKKVLRNALNKD